MIDIDRAIEIMKTDIIMTNLLFQENMHDKCDKWLYYISIYANDKNALVNSSKLLNLLNVKSKSVIMIPKSYKSSVFDCFTLSKIFNSIMSEELYNIDSISIIERSDLDYGNFYISIIRENKDTNLLDIMTYKNLLSYC